MNLSNSGNIMCLLFFEGLRFRRDFCLWLPPCPLKACEKLPKISFSEPLAVFETVCYLWWLRAVGLLPPFLFLRLPFLLCLGLRKLPTAFAILALFLVQQVIYRNA